MPIIIQLYLYSSFNLTLFLSINYPILKENCIKQFTKDGSSFEKYEQINNMFYNYRRDISYCYVPNRQDIDYTHMCLYIDKLSKALTYYLLYNYSCNTWNKDKNKHLALIKLKRFIKENPDEIICPTLPPNRSLTDTNRRSSTLRRRWTGNRRTTIEMPSVGRRTGIIPPPPSGDPPIRLNPSPSIAETRESLNTLINDIDLAVINSNAVTPFAPSYQLPRTPIRQNN